MPEPFGVTTGKWWRFERYVVSDGLIRAAEGASLEPYDPWESFRRSRSRRGDQPPYPSLLDLVQVLEFQPRLGPGPLRELTEQSEEILLGWCNAHGLLGLLPHQAVMVSLAPSWEPLEDNESVLVPTQLQHHRMDDAWATSDRQKIGTRLGVLRDQPARHGEPIRLDDAPNDWAQPGVMIQPLRTSIHREERLSATWSRFFPAVPPEGSETYSYPRPLSDEFWHMYAEPVDDFVEAAALLLNAIENLRTAKPLNDASDSDLERIRMSMDAFQSLVRTVRPAILPTPEGSLRQAWLSTSLLGSFAMMALLDLTESRRVLSCQTCGKQFVTTAHQPLYCSSTCRYKFQKRRQRAKQKEEAADEPSQ